MSLQTTAPYAVLIILYLSLNSALNIANKYVLGMHGFSFPLLLTSCHMFFSCVILAPFMFSASKRDQHVETLRKQWKGLIAVGVFMATNIALNNYSLVLMTLTLNQIIRASIPVFTCLLAIKLEKKVPSQGEAISLVVLTSGVMLTVWEGQAAGSMQGIVLCILGTISNAALMSTTGKLLSERIDVLRLTFYTAPISCAILAPLYYLRERERFQAYLQEHQMDVYVIVFATSGMALIYNIVHAVMIQRTSAVTTTVLGEAKIVGLMLLSYLLLGEKRIFTIKFAVGCSIALAGFCLYSHCKLRALHQALPEALEEESKRLLPGPPSQEGVGVSKA